MRNVVIGLSLVLAGGIAGAKSKKAESKQEITAPIEAKSGSTLAGKFTATMEGKNVKLKVEVTGAPEGEHAVHLHENADCSDPEAKKAGGHWNPLTDQHGDWHKEHHHLGDIGNMKVGKDGKGEVTLSTDKWSIGGDPKTDITGHAIVVHEKIDDFTTQPTGNAGSRIGCGVIAKTGDQGKPATPPAPAPAK